MAQRPSVGRTASTNLSTSAGARVLDGKVAIVTGASRGIGAATATILASRGANLVMNYTSESSASKTSDLAAQLEADYGIKTVIVQADMGSTNGPAHVISTAKNHFSHPKTGKFQIDILVNNAGVSVNRSIEECDADDFAFQYNINVRGPLLLVQAAVPYLPHDRSGRIVNVSSVSATIGIAKQTVYGGTKAALDAMTRTWSRELAERACVNSVNPGPVKTDMWGGAGELVKDTLGPWMKHAPLMAPREGIDGTKEECDKYRDIGGRPAYDQEIARTIAMLCGPDAGWCTGSVVCANGGMVFGV